MLQLKNENNFEKVVHFKLEDISKIKEQIAVREINLELINKSSKSISLIIPGVMSPNLLPNSTSNLKLKIGQEIIFKKTLNKSIIYTVSEKNEDGDKIYINELIEMVEWNKLYFIFLPIFAVALIGSVANMLIISISTTIISNQK